MRVANNLSSQPSRPLLSLAKLVLLTGEILEFPSPKSENMSYSIEYRTLQVSCKQETQNWTYFDDMTSESWMFTIDWKDTVSKVLPPPLLNISTIRYPGIYSHNYTSRIYEYAVNTESLICEPFSALLSVNISYTRGVRHIDHVLKDVGPIPDVTQSAYFFPYGIGKPWPNISDVPVNTPEYEDWVSTTKDRLTNWDVYAPMDASFQSLDYKWEGDVGKLAEWNKTDWNGTLVPFINSKGILPGMY